MKEIVGKIMTNILMAFLLAGNILVLYELDHFMKYSPLGFLIVGLASIVTILATIDSYLDIFRKQREARKVLESID